MGIFREYDIRGIYGKDLTADLAGEIGKAFGSNLRDQGGRRVAVCRDGRESSPALFERLLDGLNSTGISVTDIAIGPTPLLYFSLFHLPVDGGVMITASHNPSEYNGFKLCIGRETLHGEEIQAVRRRIESGEFISGTAEKTVSEKMIPVYLRYIKDHFNSVDGRGLKVVVDSGNGMGGLIGPRALRSLGCEVVELYSEPDSRFPNHHPDPTVEKNLRDLIRAVKDNHADVGIAYDGDADRIGVVDERGEIWWGDRLVAVFAREILREKPGAVILSEVKASQVLYDDIARHGGKPLMWKAGHSLIKSKMKETGAALAGELSGHIFFADRYFGYDDAIYAGCRLVEILAKTRKPLSALLSDYPKTYSTPEIRVDCPDDRKFHVVERLKKRFEEIQAAPPSGAPPIRDLITIDGVRVVFDGGWGLVRASNTQPALVLRFEAETQERLGEIRTFIQKELDSITH